MLGTYDIDDFALDVAVSGNYAYIAYGWSGLVVVDVTNPSNPTYVENWEDPDNIYWFDGICIVGNYAYLTSDGRFYILDISNPADPTLVGFIRGDWYLGLDISNGFAYLSALQTGLRVINISDPAHPTPAGSFDTYGPLKDVAVSGNYAYTACMAGGLGIVDISNPSAPHVTGRWSYYNFQIGGFEPIYTVAVSGNYAYCYNDYRGLQVINVSNPQNPVSLGSYFTQSVANDIFIRGPYAYLALSSRGLYIINISDPSNLSLVGTYDTPGTAWGVCVQGDYAYVGDGSSLQILNILNPLNPIYMGNFYSPQASPGKVFIIGSYAYLAAEYGVDAGLLIINISDPSNPTLSGIYETRGCARDVYVQDGYAYVAESWVYGWTEGMEVVNVNDPTNPTVAAEFRAPGDGYAVCLSGENVILADYYSLMTFHSNLTGIADDNNALPQSFALYQNYPNPFNAQTTISYILPQASEISLDIFDILGRKIETLQSGHQEAGEHSVIWNAENNTSGIYFYKLIVGDRIYSNKMILLR